VGYACGRRFYLLVDYLTSDFPFDR